MKIFCVGKNYVSHIREMNSEIPDTPVIFIKPATAFLHSGRPFYYPNFSKDIHYEIELVFKFSRQLKNVAADNVGEYISHVTVGLDFTARDIQKQCKRLGHPWELAKAFDFSAAVGRFKTFDFDRLDHLEFHLEKNGDKVQTASPSFMIFKVPELVQFISERFTINQGDLLFTGTPEGVGSISRGDILDGYLNRNKLLTTEIK